ncbi:MAG TPA: DUF3667 domain-containing protein [Puia sp.]|nr:DUF3667 domain-containing protein [Puia sp.]
MSRNHLRHDKTCLNCGAIVAERYCPRCGQENIEPKESVGHLIAHFFEDITHFDGKFFVTVKDLIIRPGFLTREYVAGKRTRYLNPIRMYVFISAVFFVALFAGSEESTNRPEDNTHAVNVFRQQVADSLRAVKTDSLRRSFNNSLAVRLDSAGKNKSTDESLSLNYGSSGLVLIDIEENKYNNLREYDSVQRTLADTARDKGMMHWILRNNVRQKVKHGGQNKMHLEVNIQHDIPKIMFLLLPLFALYVRWFYSRKKYYYVNHAIFSVHFHSFVFLFFLLLLLLSAIIPGHWTGLILAGTSPIPIFIYLVAALHGMYQQSWRLSLLKGLAIALLYMITMTLASTLLLVSSLLRI